MMEFKREIKFLNEVSAPINGEIRNNDLGASILQLDVSGTGFEIEVEGLVSHDGEFRKVAAVSDATYDTSLSIKQEGFYKVDISGYRAYKLNLISATSPVTCIGLEV